MRRLPTAYRAPRQRSIAGRGWPKWNNCGSLPTNRRGQLSPDSRLETSGSRPRPTWFTTGRATAAAGDPPTDAEFVSGAAGAARPEAADYCGGQKSLALGGSYPG